MNSMPVRNTERMMFNSMHNVEMPSKMSYLLFMFISFPCQNRKIAKCFLPKSQKLCLEITVLARLIAECLEIKIVSAVNQICRFASTMKKKFTRKLNVAWHRRPRKNSEVAFFPDQMPFPYIFYCYCIHQRSQLGTKTGKYIVFLY